jgi:hypothetical protein
MNHLKLNHQGDQALEVFFKKTRLFTYTYRSSVPLNESPKPYLHPVSTLAGDCVTCFRPFDHPWHSGLSLTLCKVSGYNFWGGPTYTKSSGIYAMHNNHGSQLHQSWLKQECEKNRLLLEQKLSWITYDEKYFFEETREIRVDLVEEVEGYWALGFKTCLKNVSGQKLLLGTYASSEGLKDSGYTGLFYRGTRAFLEAKPSDGEALIGAEGREGDAQIMGQRTPWVAMRGAHDLTLNRSTLIFIDDPSNYKYPNKWFVRSHVPVLSFGFIFDENYTLEPNAELKLNYRVIIANGTLSRTKIESLVSQEKALAGATSH